MALQLVQGDLSWNGKALDLHAARAGLRRHGGGQHYSRRVSPAGPGNVAVIHIPGTDGAHVVATDSDDTATFATERFSSGRSDYFHGDLPVGQATFERTGEGQPGSGWRYRFAGTAVACCAALRTRWPSWTCPPPA